MSFSSDMASLVEGQLSRFVTLNRHQLAGQVANLEFWISQIRQALSVIDGYGIRFTKMSSAQEHHVMAHDTVEFALDQNFYVSEQKAARPRRIPDVELQKSRRALLLTTSRFLKRCRNDGLISDAVMESICESLGIDQENT